MTDYKEKRHSVGYEIGGIDFVYETSGSEHDLLLTLREQQSEQEKNLSLAAQKLQSTQGNIQALKKFEERIKQLSQKANHYESLSHQKHDENKSLLDAKKKLEEDLAASTRDISHLKVKMTESESQRSNLQFQLESQVEQNIELKKRILTLEEKIAENEKSYVLEKDQFNRELSELIFEINQSHQQHQQSEKALKVLTKKNHELEDNLSSKSQKIDELFGEIEGLKQSREQTVQESLALHQLVEEQKNLIISGKTMLREFEQKKISLQTVHRAEAQELVQKISQLQAEIHKQTLEVQKHEETILKLLKERAELNAAYQRSQKFALDIQKESIGIEKTFHIDLQRKTDQIKHLENLVQQRETQGQSLHAEVQSLRESLQQREADYRELFHNSEKSGQEQKALVEKLEAQCAQNQEVLATKEQTLKAMQALIQAAQTDIQKLEKSVMDLTEQKALNSRLLDQVETLEKDLKEAQVAGQYIPQLSSRIQELSAEILSLQMANQKEAQLASELQSKNIEMAAVIDSKEHEIEKMAATMTTAIEDKNRELQQMTMKMKDWENVKMDLALKEKELEYNRKETLSIENDRQMLQSEVQILQQKIQDISVTTASSQEELEKVERQARQLQFYSENLNQEKALVTQAAKQLVHELNLAKQNNPLRDYYLATQRELSKVEIQLKKTPTISYERGYLENYLTSLVEQRDFLKSVIENSQRQVDKQTQSLMRIVQSERMLPIPPSPPKV